MLIPAAPVNASGWTTGWIILQTLHQVDIRHRSNFGADPCLSEDGENQKDF
jgi:hypothetical protein